MTSSVGGVGGRFDGAGMFAGVSVRIGGGDFPGGSVRKQTADELGMQRVTGLAGFDAAEEGKSDEGQVADQVESLVAAEFIGETERAVHDPIFREHNGVIERAAANQAHGAERLNVGLKAESAGTRKNSAEAFRVDGHFHFLLTDLRVGKIDVAANVKFVGGIDADAAAVIDDFDGLEDFKESAFAAEAADARLIEQLHERFGGTIENGDLDVIDVDVDVVNATRVRCGQKVFGGREQDALLHKAGGIADAGYVVAVGLDGKIVQVHAAEDDAGIRRRGEEAQVSVNPRV